MLGAAVGITLVIVVIGALVSVGMLIVNIVRNKDGLKFDFQSILKVYIYVISLATILVMAFGAAQTVTAGSSYLFGYQFSYRPDQYYERTAPVIDQTKGGEVVPPQVYENNDVVEINGQKYYINKKQQLRDLVNGITLFVIGAMLFAIHRFALRFLHDKEIHQSMLHRSYMLINLILFSVLGIVSIPTAVYQLINYFFLDANQLDSYTRALPGEAIGVVFAATPLWIWFLMQTIMMYRKDKK